ncbi:putative methionyl-tRNA synthetase [Hordeum vulgare]|nr:putative methionyl-tRNA synthetase [Hordeum vulgare]
MPRLAGVSDAEWRADVQRWEAVTIDRRRRFDAKRMMDAAEAAVAAAVDKEEASRAGMVNPPGRNPHATWRGRQVVAPATFSPSMPPWWYVPSPRYSDGDAYGGFNPNNTFPHGAPQRPPPQIFLRQKK